MYYIPTAILGPPSASEVVLDEDDEESEESESELESELASEVALEMEDKEPAEMTLCRWI